MVDSDPHLPRFVISHQGVDETISSRTLGVGFREKCKAIGREGGSIAADLAEGRLCHGQVNYTLSKVDEGGISEGQNKEEYHGTRPQVLWSVGMNFHVNCLMKEKYSKIS